MSNVTDEAAKESASRWADLLRFMIQAMDIDAGLVDDIDGEDNISKVDDDDIGVGYVDPNRWAKQAHTVEGGALWD